MVAPFPVYAPFQPRHARGVFPVVRSPGRGDQIQAAFWPGVLRVASFSYSCLHGIQPCTATLTTYPQPENPDAIARFGNLYVTDGFRTLVLRDCKVDSIDGEYTTDQGTIYRVNILDRRWRWRNGFGGLGGTDGYYNQVDDRGKLVPWSIRSPEELARILLRDLGELNYVIDLPPGVTRQQGANIDRYLRLGENFPYTRTNPRTEWNKIPPAEGLAWLAETFNRRIVYQPHSDRILIVPEGMPYPNKFAAPRLPDYPYEMEGQGIDDPETPSAVGVVGDLIRVQARALTEPVGEEWDGSNLFIDVLTYAPPNGANAVGIWTVTFGGVDQTRVQDLHVSITMGADSWLISSTDRPFTLAQRLADVAAKINATAGGKVGAAAAGVTLTITGTTYDDFTVGASSYDMDAGAADSKPYTAKQTQKASQGGKGWKSCPPPTFPGVTATDRLAHIEAVSLAVGSVFRTFRIVNKDPATKRFPLVLPAFGPLQRISQVVAQSTKVEQVVPTPRIAGGQNMGNPINVLGGDDILNAGVLPEFYNGRSRDQKATATGSTYKHIGRVYWWKPGPGEDPDNTKPNQRVFVDFDVATDPNGDQLVKFADYVYAVERPDNSRQFIKYPEIVVETAFVVIDAETNAPVRWTKVLPIPGGSGPVEWHHHDDIKVGIVGDYTNGPPASQATPLYQSALITFGGTNAAEVVDLRVDLSVGSTDVFLVASTVPSSLAARWAELLAAAGAYGAAFATNFTISQVTTTSVEIKAKAASTPFTARAYSGGLGTGPGVDVKPWSASIVNPITPAGGAANQPPLNTLVGWHYGTGDLEHADAASDEYLAAHALKYRTTRTQRRRYPGIFPVPMDGATQSVTYLFGDGGPTTLASLGDEWGHNFPPFYVRRRAELMAPNKLTKEANAAERAWYTRTMPRGGGATN